MKKVSLLSIFLMLSVMLMSGASPVESPNILNRAILWAPGDYNSNFFRIPAITTAPNGNIVAVADKRIDDNSDLPGRIDVVCRISEDGGKTWSETVTIAENDSLGGYGDALLITDEISCEVLCIFTHGNGFFQSTKDNHADIMLSRSNDNGKTWSEPVKISDQFFTSEPGDGEPGKVHGVAQFASSGSGVQLNSGRLMFVLCVRETEDAKTISNYAIYSEDGGYSWQALPRVPGEFGDEAKIVEQPQGFLLMSIRNPKKGNRKFSFSPDKGERWTPPVENPTMPDPMCNGDVLSYKMDSGKLVLVHSIPDSMSKRENVSLYISDEFGRKWSPLLQVVDGGSAYSSLAKSADGKIYLLVEERAPKSSGYQIVFYEIDAKNLIEEFYGTGSNPEPAQG